MKTTKNVIEKMLNFLPTTKNDYMRHIEKYGEVLNTFSVTVLEILGNDRTILETARKYMGPKVYSFRSRQIELWEESNLKIID